MKNLLIVVPIAVLSCCLSLDGSTQDKEKGKQKKDQPGQSGNQEKKNQDKGKGHDNQGKGNKAKTDDKNKDKGQGKDKSVDFDKGKSDNGKQKVDKEKGRNDVRKIVSSHGNDKSYNWDPVLFKDRNKIRNKDKVSVCHKFGRGDEPPVSINISRNALNAHLNHGDVQGDCPVYKGNRTFSDVFLGKRRDYFNTLYTTQEEVVYSQSILDYAIQRLTGARTQLVTLQNRNAPVYVVEQRQAAVTELEENVSLLETALGIAASLLVNKLTN
ncbi:MAG: hypothetical protein H7Y42_06030 [Chitinophagaceae bacterium]|nr:hypothetical protein [Chitinophagaceae bacterium]